MVSDKAANQELVFLPVVKDGNGKSFLWFVDFPAMFEDTKQPFAPWFLECSGISFATLATSPKSGSRCDIPMLDPKL